MSQATIHALIPAAGLSQRFGAGQAKQYARLQGKPVLAHSMETLSQHPLITTMTVVLAEGDGDYDSMIRPSFPKVRTVTGGPSRAHSVLNGLYDITERNSTAEYALVHDAARPCLTQIHLDELITAAMGCPDGAILAIPVSDTIKEAGEDHLIKRTLDRKKLWQAQTPQMFPVQRLIAALEWSVDGPEPPTDEASAMENQGARPRLVNGASSNIKITTSHDLIIAESIMGQSRGSN